MNLSHRPFRTNIGFIVNKPIGYSRELPFEIDKFILDGDFEVRNLAGTVTLTRISGSIRALVDFSGTVDGACGRCLEPFELNLHTRFDQIFTFDPEPLTEDQELIPPDGYLDFEILLREYLLIEIPLNPLCKRDCNGLCSICGQNLNEKLCEHQEPEPSQAALEISESKHLGKAKHSG